MDNNKCPKCGEETKDGDRLVSWFKKQDGFTVERGAIHVDCLIS